MPTRHPLRLSPTTRTLLRWLPFVAAALFSLCMAASAPEGRKPFMIDWSFNRAALEFSITKAPHIGATAVLAFLGVLATGRERWTVSLVLTVLVGWGWELCQSTVWGHTARLADLAPDAVGALLGSMMGIAALWTAQAVAASDTMRR